jgi:hypothetical protein
LFPTRQNVDKNLDVSLSVWFRNIFFGLRPIFHWISSSAAKNLVAPAPLPDDTHLQAESRSFRFIRYTSTPAFQLPNALVSSGPDGDEIPVSHRAALSPFALALVPHIWISGQEEKNVLLKVFSLGKEKEMEIKIGALLFECQWAFWCLWAIAVLVFRPLHFSKGKVSLALPNILFLLLLPSLPPPLLLIRHQQSTLVVSQKAPSLSPASKRERCWPPLTFSSDDHDCDCFLAHSSSHAAAVAALDPLMIENGRASSSCDHRCCFIQMWRWPYISPSVIVTATLIQLRLASSARRMHSSVSVKRKSGHGLAALNEWRLPWFFLSLSWSAQCIAKGYKQTTDPSKNLKLFVGEAFVSGQWQVSFSAIASFWVPNSRRR